MRKVYEGGGRPAPFEALVRAEDAVEAVSKLTGGRRVSDDEIEILGMKVKVVEGLGRDTLYMVGSCVTAVVLTDPASPGVRWVQGWIEDSRYVERCDLTDLHPIQTLTGRCRVGRMIWRLKGMAS